MNKWQVINDPTDKYVGTVTDTYIFESSVQLTKEELCVSSLAE
jgi:hypothetical protein